MKRGRLPAPALSLLVLPFVVLALPERALAYQIGSAATSPCHEEMSLASLVLVLEEGTPLPLVTPPPEEEWLGVAESLLVPLVAEHPEFEVLLDEGPLEFLALSVVLGSRAPDTAGRASSSANALRRVHLDISPDGQHRHCLRAPEDDGAWADVSALDGAEAVLAERIELAVDLGDAVERAPFFLDHHGDVEVPVFAFALTLGTALHTLEDAYAHTLRTSDGRFVLSVLNFAEAAVGELEEQRDGLSHSARLDDCRAPELRPLVEIAVQRGAALVRATLAARDGDGSLLERGLGDCEAGAEDDSCGWFEYETRCREALEGEGDLAGTCCAVDSDLCDSEWLPAARESLSAPLLSCAHGAPRGSGGHWPSCFALALLALALGRRHARAGASERFPALPVFRARRLAPRRVHAAPLVVALCLKTSAARSEAAERPQKEPEHEAGQVSFALEAHGSLLADESGGSLTDVTLGPGLRGQVRLPGDPRVSWLLSVEQNSWVALEQQVRTEPGVVSLGTGVAFEVAPHLSTSLVVGSSILLFDTALASAGSAGFFLDLRPLTLALPLAESWSVQLTPLGLSWEAPVLVEPMISLIHYRLTLGITWNSPCR